MNTNTNFVDKPSQPVPGGQYDEMGFYYTPDGSFWDPDGVYFNRDGVDKHGGYYDERLEYHPGLGWIDELMCYEDEKETVLRGRPQHKAGRKVHKGDFDEDLDEADEIDIDELYEEVDYAKLMQEEERKYRPTEFVSQSVDKKEHTVFTPGNKNRSEPVVNTNVTLSTLITPDLLFNKIPDNLKPENLTSGMVNSTTQRKEKQIEVDSLFQ